MKTPEELKAEELKNKYKSDPKKTDDASDVIPAYSDEIGKTPERVYKVIPKNEMLGIFPQPYFGLHSEKKYYLKFNREQVESIHPKTKLPIKVFADGTECQYFTDLTKADIEMYTKMETERDGIETRANARLLAESKHAAELARL